MEKINVILVALNEKSLNSAVHSLNFSKANLVAIVIDGGNGKFFSLGGRKIPCVSFAKIQEIVDAGKNFIWLISGQVNSLNDILDAKKFLIDRGVPKDNIFNFDVRLNPAWLANLRHVEKFGAEFFVTGMDYALDGLNLQNIPHGGGVNLASSNQDLRQSYLTAKYIFERVKPGTIKFVLIGLAPNAFCYDNAEDFSTCSHNLQYMLALNLPAQNRHDEFLQALISDDVKNFFANADADLNFDRAKISNNRELSAKAVATWSAELKNLTEKLFPDTIEKNFQILRDYIKLCLDNGAKPVGVVLPFALIMQRNFNTELLKLFRMTIHRLEENFDFTCVDMFDLNLGCDCFYSMTNLNLRGAAFASILLSFRLHEKNLIAAENFCGKSYDYFTMLSILLSKEDYNAFMDKIFAADVQRIRRKDKIKVGFVSDDAAMWCGDKLYNYFANDERFEPTIFLCLRTDKPGNEILQKDYLRGVEQFKSRGFNVVGLSDINAEIPAQDVMFYLRPYTAYLPNAFRFSHLTAETLIVYIPYSFTVARDYYEYHSSIYYLPWKIFFSSLLNLKLIERLCEFGVPRGIFSGYPRLDTLFEDKLTFDWKMTRPDAKKIIWAPHWSINDGVKYATFQWNFKFMYEFAKAHPEISWVVKPHPALFFSAVEAGVFPSEKAFEEYLQAWNDLPNAQVYTGAYYHAIFATSDGMIHDSASFIGEYQYAQKPMIYLTRDTQEYNEVAEGILNVSYLVDGRDLQSIAALLKKIFIAGEDPKRAEREKFFDEHLNYYKQNGMSASEFIYREISRNLKE